MGRFVSRPDPIIDSSHQKVHDGDSYSAHIEFTAVGAGASVDILIEAGTDRMHFDYLLNAENDCRLLIYEAPTATPGTAVTVYNSNRASSNTTSATITHTPTGVTPGTTIIHTSILYTALLSGGISLLNGAGGPRSPELILNANTDYLMRITNNSGGAIDFFVELGYYEA